MKIAIHSDFDEQNKHISLACNVLDIKFLNREMYTLGDVVFVGCTGWSNLESHATPAENKNLVQYGVNDFRVIAKYNKIFTVDDMLELAKGDTAFMEAVLSDMICKDKKVVVINHFAPGMQFRHKNYPINPLAAYFSSSNDLLIHEYQPDLFIYGHTHCNVKGNIRNTRVVSNQMGYGDECHKATGLCAAYNPNFIVEV